MAGFRADPADPCRLAHRPREVTRAWRAVVLPPGNECRLELDSASAPRRALRLNSVDGGRETRRSAVEGAISISQPVARIEAMLDSRRLGRWRPTLRVALEVRAAAWGPMC